MKESMKPIKKYVIIILVIVLMLSVAPMSSTKAAMDINIGDYVQMGTYYGEAILWRCVDIDENGPLMLSDKILCIKPFDGHGDSNAPTGSHVRNADRQVWGSNYWADSNIRSWLNSTASSGNVRWLCGAPPNKVFRGCNAYDKEAGFLSSFTQSEINAIKEVGQKSLLSLPEINAGMATMGTESHENATYSVDSVVANYDNAYAEIVTDKMFLLDVKQVNKVYDNIDILGNYYYIGEPTPKCVENSEWKEANLCVGSQWHYWLRSPDSGDGDGVRYVDSEGTLYFAYAFYSYIGVRPAFYLNIISSSIKSGSGNFSNPYTIVGSDDDNPTPTPAPTESAWTVSAIGDYTDKVNIEYIVIQDGKIEFTLTPIEGDISDIKDMDLFIAEYSEGNKLDNLILGIGEAVNNVLKITADIPKSNGYKIMIWNKNLAPIIKALTSINGLTAGT